MSYRKTSHSVYDIKYHIVWITKYRKQVLKGEVGLRLRELVRQVCKAQDVIIISGSVQPDPCAPIVISATKYLSE